MKKIKSIRYKLLLPVAVVVLAAGVIMGLASYQGIKGGMVFMGVEEAKMAGKGALDVIDGDVLEKMKPGCEDTEEYETLLSRMRSAQKNFGIAYLYTLYTDGEKVYYGVDADETDQQSEVGEEFEGTYEVMKDVFEGKEYTEDFIDHTDEYGDLVSAYYPIKNSNGDVVGALGCDYNAVNIVKKLNETILRTVIIVLICMIVSLVLVGIIVGKIMTNLKAVGKKIHNLVSSDGDLTKQLDVHTGDELEDIADDLNQLLGRINEQSNIAKEVAEGNLCVEVNPLSEHDLLGNALKQMVERNANTLRGIHDAATKAKIGSSQMAGASEALAKGSEEQAGAVTEITSSIKTVAQKTMQNESDAKDARKFMTEAVQMVNEVNEQMNGLMAAMNDINESAEDISKVNQVISDIAFQTNILALNASVEAARAGAAGKGFAVVAEEVRNLAGKCADASEQTTELINASIEKAGIGSELAGDTASSFSNIKEIVNKGENIVNTIAEASGEQTTAISQINETLNHVSEVVQTNSSVSAQCASASSELSGQMEEVDRMLSVYKL